MYRSHVLVCGGTGCTSSGSQQIIETLQNALQHPLDIGVVNPPGLNGDEDFTDPGFGCLEVFGEF